MATPCGWQSSRRTSSPQHGIPLEKQGRGDGEAELATAIDLYRAMAMTFWLPQTEATLAQVDIR